MSSNDQPVFTFGNQPEAQANGAAQQGDGFDNAAIDTPAPELLATQGLKMRRRHSPRLQPRRNTNSQQHPRNNLPLCRQKPKTESWKG